MNDTTGRASGLALVTGASGGLGWEFAKLLAADRYDLVLVARSADRLERSAQELREKYAVNVRTIAADLATENAAQRIFEQVSTCDVLVNNAGFASNGRFDELPQDRIHEEMLLDVVTLTELTRAYLPGMRAKHSGRILNVASTAAFLPGPYMAVYYAAKAYVLSFSEALAEECRGSGVTVTCVCPGATATGFQDRANVGNTLLMRLPLANAASVAKAGYRGMLRGDAVVVPGFSNKLVAASPKFTPRRLLLWLSRKAIERS
jgi:short-subunit dehydrogenase